MKLRNEVLIRYLEKKNGIFERRSLVICNDDQKFRSMGGLLLKIIPSVIGLVLLDFYQRRNFLL